MSLPARARALSYVLVAGSALCAASAIAAAPAAAQTAARLDPLPGVVGCEACDGPSALGRVHGLTLLSDGNVAVLDRDAPMVRIFDPSGDPVAAFGREGSGPGELRTPAGIAATADGGLAVADLRNRALVLYEAGGGVGHTRTTGSTVANLRGSPDGSWLIYQEADWSTMSAGVHLLEASPEPARLRPAGAPLPTTIGVLLDADGDPASLSLFAMAVGPDGRVAVGMGWEYRILVLSPDGSRLHEIRRDVRRVPRTPAEMDARRARRARSPGGRPGNPEAGARAPEVDPLHPHFYVDAFAYDGAGRLWVATPRGGPGRTVFDVFGPGGAYRGEAVLEAATRRFTLRDGVLAAVVEDPETGVERVRRWAIRDD